MKKVYLVSPCRTAIGSYLGSLSNVNAAALGAIVMKETLKRANLQPNLVDQVFFGNVLQGGQGQNPARQAMLQAGMPVEIPAMTLNKVCGSGLTAISMAATFIMANQADCILAGGTESMSNAPYILEKMRKGARMGNAAAEDMMIKDGLWDAANDYHMGITAENVAEKYGITREEQDAFALNSQQKAAKAKKAGRFEEEIVEVIIPKKKGEDVVFKEDEYIRENATMEQMQKLRPAFKKEGTVTAANASGINDGAAAVLVVSEDFLKKHNLKPIALYKAGASCGVDPSIMGMGPVPSVQKAVKNAGISINDLDLVELNEAFAAQAIAVNKELGINPDIINVNGGAIALGHPIGASGTRIAVSLLYEMQKQNAHLGLASLCIGGGMGEAAIFERDEQCV